MPIPPFGSAPTPDATATKKGKVKLAGDLAGTADTPALAAAGGGAAGPTGSATVTPIVTVDAKGRLIALSSATTAPTNAAGGDLTGNYPNPTLATAGPGATGPIGSSTVAPVITIDAKGRVTALTSATIADTAELAYVEFTSPVTVSATSEGTPTAVVSAGAVVYAAARIKIEFYAPGYNTGNGTGANLLANLWDASTNLGRIAVAQGVNLIYPIYAVRYLTPTAASHTYKIQAWQTVANGTILAGSGGVGAQLPGFIRVSLA